MPSEHREALQQVRMESAHTLILHRRILDRQKESNRRQLDVARGVLADERSRGERTRSQYQQDLQSAKVVWLRTKKDGARLLQVVDRYFKKAA